MQWRPFQLLSEAAIHPRICAQFQTRNKSQGSRSQECPECQTLYRNQTCQRMSYGVQMSVTTTKRGAEDGRGGGTASSHYAKVKLIETIDKVESRTRLLGIILQWWMLRE